ncbi:hypothetical protein PITCH_A2050013 [uncultured Desulfobacterium sp.]|uniref:Uncharacterized protein n=1 Tax=uncultured Desulfobacterium sp. TaxID=201089 RepID=A0A445MXD0_9BACT|nr:hypothetical protein PITCH_A2050013 [uncultured Desulfobacterium sp.]
MIKLFMLHTTSFIIHDELTYLEKELYINFSLFQGTETAGNTRGRSISKFLRDLYARCKLSPRAGRRKELRL